MRDGAIRAWLACLLLPHLWAVAQEGDAAELRRLAERQRALATMSASFTWQVVQLGEDQASRPVRQGDLVFAAPASYNIVVRQADGGTVDRWCSDGQVRWEVTQLGPEDPADVRGPLPAGDGDADSRLVLACLRLDVDRLGSDYRLRYLLAEEGGRVIRLQAPEGAADGRPAALAIHLDAQGDPGRVDIEQADGSRWLLRVVRMERDAVVDPAAFRVAR